MSTFMDKHEDSVTSGLFVVEPRQNQRWWTIPGERDRGHGANAAFADGHVSFKKWQYLGRKRTGALSATAGPCGPGVVCGCLVGQGPM
jgi:prepilin-type processing-associated H-X9-DG protein